MGGIAGGEGDASGEVRVGGRDAEPGAETVSLFVAAVAERDRVLRADRATGAARLAFVHLGRIPGAPREAVAIDPGAAQEALAAEDEDSDLRRIFRPCNALQCSAATFPARSGAAPAPEGRSTLNHCSVR